MALKKWVRGVVATAVMVSGGLMNELYENKLKLTEIANKQDAMMHDLWDDLNEEYEAGKLGKQEVVDKMQPHMAKLKEMEGEETIALFKIAAAGLVGLGGIALLTKNSIGGVRREDEVDAPKAKANKLG